MNRIEKGQFPIPQESARRRNYALKMIWAGLLVDAIFIAGTIWSVVASDELGGILAMVGLSLTGLAVVAWAFYWYYKHSNFQYELGPITVIFRGPDYYVPQDKMQKLVDAVMTAWQPLMEDEPTEVAYQGVRLVVQADRPIDPAGRTDKVIGLTYHARRTSYVWGPYALNEAGAGYELCLHAAEYLWPGSPEALKIDRMRDLGVLGRLHKEYSLSP